jgi:hypothetical protein
VLRFAADRIICAPRKVHLQARRERVTTDISSGSPGLHKAPYAELPPQRSRLVPPGVPLPHVSWAVLTGAVEQGACWIARVAHLNSWRTRERGGFACAATAETSSIGQPGCHHARFGGAIERRQTAMRRGPALPNPARLHRLSTVSFWRAPSRNGYEAPCAFTVEILWLPAMSWSQGMFFADSSTNAAYWAQRQRELGADELVSPRERPKEGTTPAVVRPTSAAGSHPQLRLFGTGLPSRARCQRYATAGSAGRDFAQPCYQISSRRSS